MDNQLFIGSIFDQVNSLVIFSFHPSIRIDLD